ncbi:MAG: guanylate kinase [bacterium JZ-2024 1]
MKGFLVVISGASGVGKNTVVREVLKEKNGLPLHQLITYTTRAPRNKEEEGKDYHFVSEEEFRRLRESNFFLEWAEVHGKFYGSPYEECQKYLREGKIVLAVLDVQGALNIRRRIPESVLIFLFPPSEKEWIKRLQEQDLTEQERQTRLNNGWWERKMAVYFDYFVVNQEVSQAAQEILHILYAESLRGFRRAELIASLEGEK